MNKQSSKTVVLPVNSEFTERGNIHLSLPSLGLTSTAHLFFLRLDVNQWLRIYLSPASYPSLSVTIVTAPDKTLAKTINKYYKSWAVNKLNLDGVKTKRTTVFRDRDTMIVA
jgi:hypothetical protein